MLILEASKCRITKDDSEQSKYICIYYKMSC